MVIHGYHDLFEHELWCMMMLQKKTRKESALSSLYGKQHHHQIAKRSGASDRAS